MSLKQNIIMHYKNIFIQTKALQITNIFYIETESEAFHQNDKRRIISMGKTGRADNNKWYGVILSVAGSKLGLEDDNIIDVINLKSDPMLIGSLRGQKGYFPAYHMNKEKWISVLLGDAGLDEPIKNLLALSYELTAPKKKKNTSK